MWAFRCIHVWWKHAMCNAGLQCSKNIIISKHLSRHVVIQSGCGNKNILITMVHGTWPPAAVCPIPSLYGFDAIWKMSSWLAAAFSDWLGVVCDVWHFKSFTRRSTEGILDFVSEQTKHTVIYTTIGDACVCNIWPISARTPSFRHQTSRKFFSHSNFPIPYLWTAFCVPLSFVFYEKQ